METKNTDSNTICKELVASGLKEMIKDAIKFSRNVNDELDSANVPLTIVEVEGIQYIVFIHCELWSDGRYSINKV